MKILRNLHFVLSTAATLALAVAGSEAMAESHSTYPNELQGYTLHAIAKWKSLQPLISSRAEAVALLGTPEAVFYNAGPAWNYVVYYWSEQGSCNGHPFPSQLLGKVESIELVPKVRTSLSGVTFPAAFKKTPVWASHDPVGGWDSYLDEHGLDYQVYTKDSRDGSIKAGDLKAIVYGPSRKLYADITGCR